MHTHMQCVCKLEGTQSLLRVGGTGADNWGGGGGGGGVGGTSVEGNLL